MCIHIISESAFHGNNGEQLKLDTELESKEKDKTTRKRVYLIKEDKQVEYHLEADIDEVVNEQMAEEDKSEAEDNNIITTTNECSKPADISETKTKSGWRK